MENDQNARRQASSTGEGWPLAARRLLTRREVSGDGRAVFGENDGKWEGFYRNRWAHDRVVRSTHGVNCTGSCSWMVYVKDGIITWEHQATDYPSIGADCPEYEPRGCPRGASFSWYTYSPSRVRYPYVRGTLLKLWREARRRLGDPVAAWAEITGEAGLGMLCVRRLLTRRIRLGTDRSDKLLFPLLSATVLLGITATAAHNVFGDGYDYRSTVSVWFRGLFTLQPQPEAIAGAPLLFQVHALTACLLFAAWPFTRLVHVWSAPIGYLVRPYLVYRRRATPAAAPTAGGRPRSSSGSRRAA